MADDRIDPADAPVTPDPLGLVDEADRLEQQTPVPGEDDGDYPHDGPEAGGGYG